MIVTTHAQQRWDVRFPNLSIENEYNLSKGIGQGEMFRRATRCLSSRHDKKMLRNGGTHYMLLSKSSGAVFIMDRGAIIITVMKIDTC